MPEFLVRQRQLIIYLIGGVLSAGIDVGLMQLMIYQGVNYMLSASAGFAAGLLFNFAYHAGMTFSATISAGSFARYLCVVALGYLLTLACVEASVQLTARPLIGKLLALPLVAALGFVLGKRWIFK